MLLPPLQPDNKLDYVSEPEGIFSIVKHVWYDASIDGTKLTKRIPMKIKLRGETRENRRFGRNDIIKKGPDKAEPINMRKPVNKR